MHSRTDLDQYKLKLGKSLVSLIYLFIMAVISPHCDPKSLDYIQISTSHTYKKNTLEKALNSV